MSAGKQFLLVLVYAVISLVIYYGIKIKILSKYKIKKRYIILTLALVFIIPFLIIFATKSAAIANWLTTVQMILVTVVFLVYLEVVRIEKLEKSKPVVGKPKPKQSRAKNEK